MNFMPLLRLIAAAPVFAVMIVLMFLTVPVMFVTVIPLLLFFETCLLASVFVSIANRGAGSAVVQFADRGIMFSGAVLEAIMVLTLGWYFDHVVDRVFG